MGILKSVGSVIKKALDTNLALFAAPVTTLTKGVSAGISEVEKQGALERTARILGTTAVAAGAVLTAGTSAGRAAAAAVIPKTTKGKVIAAVAAPIAIGAVSKAPKKVAETVIKSPAELAEFGAGVAGVVTEPSIQSVKELIQDSPILTAATGVLVGGVAIKAAAPIIGGLLTSEAIQEAADKPLNIVTTAPVAGVAAPVSQPSGGAPMPQPVTPQLVGVSKTSTKKKKRAHKPVIQPISQRVNVIVSNSANQRTTKNYISREVLAV